MIKIGIVGARGLSCLAGLRGSPNVQVTALCDIDATLLKQEAEKHNIPNTYRVYEDMLEADINAVVVATPMQNHFQQVVAALEAGKHVLSEVTAGVTMDELFWLVEAVEKYNQVYMMAENYMYIPENQMLNNMVQRGVFGDVYFAEGEYLHNIAALATYQNGNTSWRSYWQLGKRGAFYPTHSLGPVMQWFPNDPIVTVQCVGTGSNTYPQFRQEDTTLTICKTKSGKLIKLRVDCLSKRPHNMTYYSIQGTKGAYEAPRGLGDNHKVWLDTMNDGNPDWAQWQPLTSLQEEFMPARYLNATTKQLAEGHWGGDFFIAQDFISAIANGTKPAVDVYEACEWTAVGLLSELSIMNGGRIMDMPHFRPGMPRGEQIIKL